MVLLPGLNWVKTMSASEEENTSEANSWATPQDRDEGLPGDAHVTEEELAALDAQDGDEEEAQALAALARVGSDRGHASEGAPSEHSEVKREPNP